MLQNMWGVFYIFEGSRFDLFRGVAPGDCIVALDQLGRWGEHQLKGFHHMLCFIHWDDHLNTSVTLVFKPFAIIIRWFGCHFIEIFALMIWRLPWFGCFIRSLSWWDQDLKTYVVRIINYDFCDSNESWSISINWPQWLQGSFQLWTRQVCCWCQSHPPRNKVSLNKPFNMYLITTHLNKVSLNTKPFNRCIQSESIWSKSHWMYH